MSSEFMIRDAAAPTDPDSDLLLRHENTVSTPINSVSWLGNGSAISDVYTVTGTSSSTVNVTADDPKNEHVASGITVVADDATVNRDVVPGVGIVFSSSLANGWTAKIAIGALMASGGSTSARFNIGVVESDDESTQRRIVVFNVGSETGASTTLFALPGFFVDGAGYENFITLVKNHTAESRQDLATAIDLVMTFADYQSGASPKTVDVYIGGVKAIEDAKLDGSTLYQYGEGNGYIDGQDKLKGLGIIFADDPGDPTSSTFTIHVREGFEYIWFAPDVTGAPGSWVQSTLPDLTESGETTGTITAGGYAHAWFKAIVPQSASPGDRKLFIPRVRSLTV